MNAAWDERFTEAGVAIGICRHVAADFEGYIPQGQSLASPYPYLLPFLYGQLHVGLHTSLSYSKGPSFPQSVALAS